MKKLLAYKFEILIFVLFVGIRMFDLGHDTFNTDVFKWKSRSYNFSTGVFSLDFGQTIQKYHPGVTLMWIGTAGIKFYNLYSELFLGGPPTDNSIETIFGLHFAQKLIMVLILGITAGSIFYALRKITNNTYAWLSVVLLMMEPFYVALTRAFHLEALMTTFMIASFVWFLYYLQEKTKKAIILSTFFGALSVLTKTTAIYIILFTGLVLLIHYFKENSKIDKDLVIKIIRTYLPWTGLFVLFFFLIWPAMWVDPAGAVRSLWKGITDIGIEGEHVQLYFGNLVYDPGIFYYFVVFGLRSSVVLLIGLAGYLAVFKRFRDEKIKSFILYAFLFALFYLIELTIPTKKLDRYILPVLTSMTFISSAFYYYLFKTLENSKNKIAKFSKYLLFLPLVLCLVRLHPDYLGYYSPLFGGLKKGMFVLEPKWMFGQQEIENYFLQLKTQKNYSDFESGQNLETLITDPSTGNKLVVGFPEKYYTQISPFIRKAGGYASIFDIKGFAEISNYAVFPVWDDKSDLENRFELQYLDSIKVDGVDVYNVYANLGPK